MKRIPLWVDLRGVPVNRRLPYWKAVRDCRCERVLLGNDDPHLEREDALRIDGRQQIKQGTRRIGSLVRLRSARDQERAAQAKGTVIVEGDEWQVIPLENLIAARRDRPGTLFALARDMDQVRLFRDTLETGVHGIALRPRGVEDIEEAHAFLLERGPRQDDALPGASGPSRAARPSSVPAPGSTGNSGASVQRSGQKSGQKTDGSAGTTQRSGDKTQGLPGKTAAKEEPGRSAPARGSQASKGGKSRPRRADPQQMPGPGKDASADKDFLVPATITAVEDAGPGDRVCIDTTSLMRPGEGLLVGSTARNFLLVQAETLESEYVRARPFRVNAGAVHSYLFAPEGRTQYLSELRAGMPVLTVHPDGIHRVLVIGRSKIERRPHTLVGWTTPDGEGSAVLQTAETVRLVRTDGRPVAVTSLKEGDQVWAHEEGAARHFGMPVEEALEER